MRETLFNWLGQTLYGRTCLDLFAGSGALGFEAASRGAARVVMVEKNPVVFRALQANFAKLACNNRHGASPATKHAGTCTNRFPHPTPPPQAGEGEHESLRGFHNNVVAYCQDGLEFAFRDLQRFDVIFLDPPFDSDYLPRLLEILPQRLNDNGVVYVESGMKIAVSPSWRVMKSGKAGQVHYQLLGLSVND